MHIHRKRNKGCFATFTKENPTILIALAGHDQGDERSEEVLCGYEVFICSLFCPNEIHIWEAMVLRCFLFKQPRGEQGVDTLPPTQGAWIEHMRCAHVQANIWHQAMVLNPTCLDPLTLGVNIPRPKASAGSFSGCTSSSLSAAARQVYL